MAGFPYWQLDRFLKILVQDLNKYVAISEEFPISKSDRTRSGGPEYERKVARVVTPGTLIDESFLDPFRNNFLLAVEAFGEFGGTAKGEKLSLSGLNIGLAWLDLSTGDFFTQTVAHALLPSTLMRIGPREVLVAPDTPQMFKEEIALILGHAPELLTLHNAISSFESMESWNPLLEQPISSSANSSFPLTEKLAGHRLLDYVQSRLQYSELRLRLPQRKHGNEVMAIDRGSLRGLEILETAKDGFGKGSLLHAIRRTVTRSGSRLLRERLTNPLTCVTEINHRLALVTEFIRSETLREDVITCLKGTYDVQRLMQKFALNKGDADDMLCLARAINEISKIKDLLQNEWQTQRILTKENPCAMILNRFDLTGPNKLARRIIDAIDEIGLDAQHRIEEGEDIEVAALVQKVVAKHAPEELPSLVRKARPRIRTSSARAHYEENDEAWIMRRCASKTLDRLHANLEVLKTYRERLQDSLRDQFATPKLELRWTPGLGHICHIQSAKALGEDVQKQLGVRVVSSSKSTRSVQIPEWTRLGEELGQARLSIREEESRIFRQLRQEIIINIISLRRNAVLIDELDVATGFAKLAQEQNWTRPVLTDSVIHRIVGGRHPTVKLGLEERGRTFVSNDLFLGERESVWLVTGPNMAGKSTFLRQNALITILAQIGSYVPADFAEIGVVDQIFSRIGAADDLFRNQSTFMVEMLETAAILRHATPRSFVIMDEVGRGTTPEDGTAVSFASLHHLYHVNKCRTLFATHFHALVDMTAGWAGVGKYCTDVLENPNGSFTFVHKLKPGVNRQSHALKVAKIAGLPDSALTIAKLVQQQITHQNYGYTDLEHGVIEADDQKIKAAGSG